MAAFLPVLVSVVVGGMVLHFLFNCNTLEQMSLPCRVILSSRCLVANVGNPLRRGEANKGSSEHSGPARKSTAGIHSGLHHSSGGCVLHLCTSPHTAVLGLQRVTLIPQDPHYSSVKWDISFLS